MRVRVRGWVHVRACARMRVSGEDISARNEHRAIRGYFVLRAVHGAHSLLVEENTSDGR